MPRETDYYCLECMLSKLSLFSQTDRVDIPSQVTDVQRYVDAARDAVEQFPLIPTKHHLRVENKAQEIMRGYRLLVAYAQQH